MVLHEYMISSSSLVASHRNVGEQNESNLNLFNEMAQLHCAGHLPSEATRLWDCCHGPLSLGHRPGQAPLLDP